MCCLPCINCFNAPCLYLNCAKLVMGSSIYYISIFWPFWTPPLSLNVTRPVFCFCFLLFCFVVLFYYVIVCFLFVFFVGFFCYVCWFVFCFCCFVMFLFFILFCFLPHRCRCNFTNIPLCAVENMLKKPTGDVTMASDPPPFHQMSPWTPPPRYDGEVINGWPS